MKIAGFVKTSLIDYPGNVAAVVFTQGCNFRCGFCHNPELLDISKNEGLINEEDVLNQLEKKKNILDGVVITGGEPTLQPDLVEFIEKLKAMGFLVKLDTNGANFTILEKLLEQKLVDYVAMDIKGKLSDYEKICGPVNISSIKKSINFLKKNVVPYEFRTTVLPFYHKIEDFDEIGKTLDGASKYTIQGFRSEITFDEKLKQEKSFTLVELEKIKEKMIKHVKNVTIFANI